MSEVLRAFTIPEFDANPGYVVSRVLTTGDGGAFVTGFASDSENVFRGFVLKTDADLVQEFAEPVAMLLPSPGLGGTVINDAISQGDGYVIGGVSPLRADFTESQAYLQLVDDTGANVGDAMFGGSTPAGADLMNTGVNHMLPFGDDILVYGTAVSPEGRVLYLAQYNLQVGMPGVLRWERNLGNGGFVPETLQTAGVTFGTGDQIFLALSGETDLGERMSYVMLAEPDIADPDGAFRVAATDLALESGITYVDIASTASGGAIVIGRRDFLPIPLNDCGFELCSIGEYFVLDSAGTVTNSMIWRGAVEQESRIVEPGSVLLEEDGFAYIAGIQHSIMDESVISEYVFVASSDLTGFQRTRPLAAALTDAQPLPVLALVTDTDFVLAGSTLIDGEERVLLALVRQ